MDDSGITNYWWPELTDRESAQKTAFQGVWAAGFVSGVTAILSIGGWMGLGLGGLVDAALFAGLAFGIKMMSRTAAVAGLLLYLSERLFTLANGGGSGGWSMTIVIALMLTNAVRGTFAYHRFKSAGTPSGLFIPPKS